MNYKINEQKGGDISVTYTLDDKTTLNVILSLSPYLINQPNANGDVVTVAIQPNDNLDSFLSNYLVAFLNGKKLEVVEIDKDLIGKIVEINQI